MQKHASKDKLAFNHAAAGLLRDMAELLSQQEANPFRINASRRAAQTLDTLDIDSREILQREGEPGLVALPAIGRGIASSVAEIARTGRLSQLERLRGSVNPETLFQTVPGIGPESAKLIHDELHVDSLARAASVVTCGHHAWPSFARRHPAHWAAGADGRRSATRVERAEDRPGPRSIATVYASRHGRRVVRQPQLLHGWLR